MKEFRGKATVSSDKIRGGYYTPPAVARFLADWVSVAGPSLLEPACGDGAILKELARHTNSALGIELVEIEAKKARKYAAVETSNLFDWPGLRKHGSWDGVAGNPPYIRFGSWPEELRQPALDLMSREGLRPSRLTNSWVPFVVASVVATRPGGRLGLVLPAEILQVSYASQLRDYLLGTLSELTVITFGRLVFEGILQEVVLLLGVRGQGPAMIRTVHLSDADGLIDVDLDKPAAPALLHDHEKWTKYFLSPEQIKLLRAIRTDGRFTQFGDVASVDVGIVTGRNSFFTFTDDEVRELGLSRHCLPLVSRSAQLGGLRYDDECFSENRAAGHRTWILNADPDDVDPALMTHIKHGEAQHVHEGYKCSLRTPWWRTPSAWRPDAFMLRQIHKAPRVTVNLTNATSTDTVHRVRIGANTDPLSLATVFHNSATFAFSEVMGRSYGGGVLELEPREAELLPIPDPELVPAGLAEDVDMLLRSGEVRKAVDLTDRAVLVEGLGWSQETVDQCRSAWLTLRDRRSSRGRRKS